MADPFELKARLAEIGDLGETRSEFRTRLSRIEALLGYLTAKALTGDALNASDEPVLTFFGISSKHPNPLKRIAEIGALRSGRKLGTVECPSCGSNVHDLEGVTEETCSFCGATVTTES